MRAERSTIGPSSTVATAAMAAPTAANSPKWWIHFVGANVSRNRVAKMTPIKRHTGPVAMPGIRLRRNNNSIDGNKHAIVIRIPKRRDTAASVVGRTR